jgi:hypothetical protein
VNARADADGGHGGPLGQLLRQGPGNRLDHHRENPRLLNRFQIAENSAGARFVFSLNDLMAILVLGLRPESDMPHDRNARVHDSGDRLGHLRSRLPFSPLGHPFFSNTPRCESPLPSSG